MSPLPPLSVFASLTNVQCRTRHRSLPLMHKILFGACCTMYVIAASHLSLLLEEATHGIIPSSGVGKAAIVLASFQVRHNRIPSFAQPPYPRLYSLLLATRY